MKSKMLAIVVLVLWSTFASAGEPDTAPPPRHITLEEAVQLALQHNHLIRINQFKVEEQQHVKEAAKSAALDKYLDVTEEPLVSADFKGNPHSSIVDALSTYVVGGNMVKVLSWYDNEWGYSNRVVDLIEFMASKN